MYWKICKTVFILAVDYVLLVSIYVVGVVGRI